jgi:hypothetical protein
MKGSSRFLLLTLLAAMCTNALATGSHSPPTPTPKDPTVNVDQDVNVGVGVKNTNRNTNANTNRNTNANTNRNTNTSNSTSASTSSNTTTVDASTASAADANQDQSQAQDQSIQFRDRLQAPTIVAPGAFPAIGCGRGVAIGGSVPGGGASIGFNWSNKDCEDFARHVSLAQAYAAIGMWQEACTILSHLPLATQAVPAVSCRGVAPPPAPTPVPPQSIVITVPPTQSALNEKAVDEKIDRAFRRAQGK